MWSCAHNHHLAGEKIDMEKKTGIILDFGYILSGGKNAEHKKVKFARQANVQILGPMNS